jgi:predicted enzyme related to lactoylglutathione lyase
MTLLRVEAGFVSTEPALVDFYAEVFELTKLEPAAFPVGTLHKLEGPTGTIKVMVPADPPAPAAYTGPFTGMVGLRYLTLRVDDLDAVIERATARGATVLTGPLELRPGVRIAVLNDPEGNTIEVGEPG